MTEPRWITQRGLLLLHEQSLSEHGGAVGIRDLGLLESALARPRNLLAYERVTDIARLAASYCFGIARNHPFVDGNKRTAFLAIGLFLQKNGHDLSAPQPDAYGMMVALAAGELGEEELANWIAANTQPK